jgi:hypothetical protein
MRRYFYGLKIFRLTLKSCFMKEFQGVIRDALKLMDFCKLGLPHIVRFLVVESIHSGSWVLHIYD